MGWTARVVLSAIASVGLVTAQYPAGHAAGVVIPAQFGVDDQEDFLVFDGRWFHAWEGRAEYPYLRKGPATLVYFDRSVGKPLVVGRHLFLPMAGTYYAPQAKIAVLEILADGSLLSRGELLVRPDQWNGIVHSLCLVPLTWDEGADSVPDLLAIWAETPAQDHVSMHCAILDWQKIGEVQELPSLSHDPETLYIASCHASENLAQPSGEFLMVLSKTPSSGTGHLGFVTIARERGEFRIQAEEWFTSAPSVRDPGWAGTRSPVCYGRFSPTPVLAVPAVTLFTGPTAVFHPRMGAPYVARTGRAVDTSRQGYMLDGAVADFDGDGADEVVFVEPHFLGAGSLVVVADPHPQDRGLQAFTFAAGVAMRDGSSTGHSVPFHGAAVDLNGDGRKDLVFAVSQDKRGGLAVMLGNPASTRNGAGLYRVH